MSDAALAGAYLADLRERFAALRALAERALAQVDDASLAATFGAEDNSIAVVLLHVGGNLRSRFTDFLGTDGEKPDRDRDREFELGARGRREVEAAWDAGWRALEETLAALAPEDLLTTVRIRGEAMPVIAALSRALSHTAQHVGQVVLLAKHHRGDRWESLSIPRARPDPSRKLPGASGV